MYKYSGEQGDMTSFTRRAPQEPGAPTPEKTYRVIWTWRNTRQVSASGLDYENANALCHSLSALASQYNQDDEYTVEAE